MRTLITAAALAAALIAPAAAQPAPDVPDPVVPIRKESTRPVKKPARNIRKESEKIGYKKVSSLVDFPAFYPGIGALYVRPNTLPYGPFRSFDHKDKLISTIYMVPLEEMNDKKSFDLRGVTGKVDHVTIYYNAGHAGVMMPHYHVVIWHVSKKEEALVAK